MKTKKFLIACIIIILMVVIVACDNKSPNSEKTSNSSSDFDRTAYAVEIGTPLSEEDSQVDILAKSTNPNKVLWRHGIVTRSLEENPTGRAERQFFIELKKRLGDKVEIQLFTGGSLGTTADQILGGLQNRNFESQSYNVGAFAEYTNAWTPLDVMFLIPDREAGAEIVAGEPGELMNQKCIEDTGLNVIVRGAIGMRHITSTGKPINNVADFKGVKIRVQNNPLHILAFDALGAAPTPIAYAELFTSLQQKVVDAQENPIANIYDQNYEEVQDYMTLTNHLYTAEALVLNNDWLLEQDEDGKATLF